MSQNPSLGASTEKWNVHPLNYRQLEDDDERQVYVIDSTIRSICTSEPGSFITPGQMVEIIAKLEDVGVKSVMFNVDHMGGRSELAYETAKLAIEEGFQTISIETGGIPLVPYERDEWKDLFHRNVKFGFQGLGISYGAGKADVEGFHGTRAVFDQMHEIVEYMNEQGYPPTLSFNIKPHRSFAFFMEFVRESARAGCRYFRVYDTVASMSPHTIEMIIRHIREEFTREELPLVLHTHNGLGMAVPSTCAAVHAGIQGIDVAVNAVGTKSGHTCMIETVVALETLYGVRTGIKLEELTSLCRLVERHLGIRVHDNKPMVGRHAFLREQSFKVIEALQARMEGREYVTPFAPSLVGGTERIVWGKNTIKPDAVELKLMEMKLPATGENVDLVMQALRTELTERTSYPSWLEDEEAEEVIRQTLHG